MIDNYTLFYHKFLNQNHFEEHFWQNQINTPAINSWSGLAFEKVCLEHVPQIKKALGISGVYTDVNAWQCKADEKFGIKGAQIDLMLVRKDQIINLCEMKYTESAFSVTGKFILDMNEKIKSLREKSKTNYAIHPTLVTTYPVARNEYAGDLQAIITLEDLFAQ